MKRTLLLLMTLWLGGFVFGQQNVINTWFSAYLDASEFEKMSVSSKTFDLFQEMESNSQEEQRVLNALSNIEGILVLSNKEAAQGLGYYVDAMQKLDSDEQYQDLVQVEDKNAKLRLLIREDETGIKEFVMVAGETDRFVLASIYGDIDLKNISRLGQVIREEKEEWFKLFNHLEEEHLVFDRNANDETSKTYLDDLALTIYPNPASDHINIASEKEKDATLDISFFSLMGQPLQEMQQVQLPYRLELAQLPAGTYFVRLTDNNGQFRNFRVVKP